MDIIGTAVSIIFQLIDQIGYLGIIILMALEGMGIPVPSEIVLHAGGWMASSDDMDIVLVIAAGTISCAIGSAIAYHIGLKGGRAAVLRYGKYLHLREDHLDAAQRWFERHGTIAILITRLLPVIRTYISFPAGMAKMRFWPFIIISTIGSAIWCIVLSYAGYVLGPEWEILSGSFHLLTVAVLVVLIVLVAYWYFWGSKAKGARTSHQ